MASSVTAHFKLPSTPATASDGTFVRFSLTGRDQADVYKQLTEKLTSFSLSTTDLAYIDIDGDLISIKSSDDLAEAISLANGGTILLDFPKPQKVPREARRKGRRHSRGARSRSRSRSASSSSSTSSSSDSDVQMLDQNGAPVDKRAKKMEKKIEKRQKKLMRKFLGRSAGGNRVNFGFGPNRRPPPGDFGRDPRGAGPAGFTFGSFPGPSGRQDGSFGMLGGAPTGSMFTGAPPTLSLFGGQWNSGHAGRGGRRCGRYGC